MNEFKDDDYNKEWLLIRRFLITMTMDTSMTREEARQLWKNAQRHFLLNGKIWTLPKRQNNAPLKVIAGAKDQVRLISEFHESPWSRHQGTWATFKKLKGKLKLFMYITIKKVIQME